MFRISGDFSGPIMEQTYNQWKPHKNIYNGKPVQQLTAHHMKE